MVTEQVLNKNIIEKFEDISTQLYNFKHALKLFINHLEDYSETPIEIQCLALILKDYFEKVKNDYNKLEEELNII